RLGEVECPAAVGHERNAGCRQSTVFFVAHLEAAVERMALAGEDQVDVAIELDAHGSARLAPSHPREPRPRVTLRLLPTEPAAHARRLDCDLISRAIEDMGDDRLDFGGMLRRRGNEDLAIFATLGPGGVRLEIEVLLTSHLDLAGQAMWALGECL